jgi:hypothetical protein
MDAEMLQKIEAVLDRVKEPESQLTIAQLGPLKKYATIKCAENCRFLLTRSIPASAAAP